MAVKDFKELKGINNVDFYPTHYFTESLSTDAKARGFDGSTIKALKKKLGDSTSLLTEDEVSIPEGLHDQIQTEWIKALGFYDKPGMANTIFQFSYDQKILNLEVERQINFRREGQLWILKGKHLKVQRDESELSSGRIVKDEVFHQSSTELRSKDGVVKAKWKKIIDGIFDSDFSSCEYLIVHLGDKIILAERGRWQEDQCAFLELDIPELFAVNSDLSFQVTEAHFSAGAFGIDSTDFFLESLEKNAHKKASEVTKALRDTVRESIEILANEILSVHKRAPIAELEGYDFKKDDHRKEAAAKIFDQSLRFVYRMLFMFFAESQDQRKGALPVQSRVYQMGYSLEKLRSLEAVPFLEKDRYFIHETLNKAFSIYFSGYNRDRVKTFDKHLEEYSLQTDALGFSFPQLGTDLFSPKKTSILESIRISDGPMQEVLRKLSLARVGKGRGTKTYRVHYAGLGLNQLGAVYEGLLSLNPEIMTEKVKLLARGPKDSAHRYVAVRGLTQDSELDFATDESGREIVKETGSFVLTPAGLERKFSASFYTPEVLTRFLAKESVDQLLKDSATIERIESLKICEPAMGSGAFLNAVVDEIAPRLAKEYKKRDSENKSEAVQELNFYISKAKQHLMKNCVYGVDLNATAVELAKVSLWLNSLHEDGNLPFLDFKLKHGNSLVGCWVTRHQIDSQAGKFSRFLVPEPNALDTYLNATYLSDRSDPILTSKESDKLKSLKAEWTKILTSEIYVVRLKEIQKKVDNLYIKHVSSRKSYLQKIQEAENSETKIAIANDLIGRNSEYNQLRFMMDVWCSIWFWPSQKISSLPSADDYLTWMEFACEEELGYSKQDKIESIRKSGLSELEFSVDRALELNFFHWDLEYAEIFDLGGFDLVLGNPPWAPVRWEEADFFFNLISADHTDGLDAGKKKLIYAAELESKKHHKINYAASRFLSDGYAKFLKASNTFPYSDSSQTNTYRYFFQRFQEITQENGTYSIIAQDGIFNDEGCLEIRRNIFPEVAKAYRFQNELKLFEDVDNHLEYMVSTYTRGKSEVKFQIIDNLYHPDTVNSCLKEDPNADYRGCKDDQGNFELRGHPQRIVEINKDTLSKLAKFSGNEDWFSASLPTMHGKVEAEILLKLASHCRKLDAVETMYWRRFDESGAARGGLISKKSGQSKSLAHSTLTGPNIFVGNPAAKSPNVPWKNNRDFYENDLDTIPDDFFPDTVYQTTEKGLKSSEYKSTTPWGSQHSAEYRIFARQMVNITGVRTLSTAILPPGPMHVHSMLSLSFKDPVELLACSGLFNSLIFDFLMRSISGGTIGQSVYDKTPCLTSGQLSHPLTRPLLVRALRLSSISTHYKKLWEDSFHEDFKTLELESQFAPKLAYGALTNEWQRDTCIRNEHQREQALCEIDAIVAILFGFEKDTLLKLYRSQFGVLQKTLQDLSGKKRNPDNYHFPRYQQMSEAYDQCIDFVHQSAAESIPRKKRSNGK